MHPLKRRGKSNDQLLSENEVMLLILIEIHFAFYELELFQIIILIFSSSSFPPHFIFFPSSLLFLLISSYSLLHFLLILISSPFSLLPSLFSFFLFSSSLPPLSSHISLLYRNPAICYFSYSFLRSTFYHHLFDVMRLQRYAFIGQMTLLSSKSSGNPDDGGRRA